MLRIGWITGAAIAGCVLVVGAREARADFALAGDLDLAVPVDQAPQRYLSTGAGFDFRAGWRFRVPYQSIQIIPEVALGYTELGAHLVRVRPGLRVGIGRLLVPYLYGHVGYGWTSFDPLGSADRSPAPTFTSAQGLSLDTGLGLDVTILRRLTVGAHLGYNVVGVASTTVTPLSWRAQWMSLGLNVTLYL